MVDTHIHTQSTGQSWTWPLGTATAVVTGKPAAAAIADVLGGTEKALCVLT